MTATSGTVTTTSVLITTYNGERFIIEQLQSIADQSLAVDRVLICDDRSTDGTVEVVREFIDRNGLDGWEVVVNETNVGFGQNNLMHFADTTGDVVFLADQDDVWHSDKVKIMATYLAEHPDVALLVSRTTTVDHSGRSIDDTAVGRQVARGSRIHRGPASQVQDIDFDDFVGDSVIPLHAMCVRGAIMRTIGRAGNFPDVSNSLGADWYVGIWSTALGRGRLLSDVLVRRRVHDSNISLGSLRKTGLLAATSERRTQILIEGRLAHLSLLQHPELSKHLDDGQRKSIERVSMFMAMRIEFADRPNVVRTLRLLSAFRLYSFAAGTAYLGLRMFIADVMYAYRGRGRRRNRL